MPGGNLEYGESAEDAIIREVWEETGFHVSIEKLLMTKTFAPDKFALYFLCVIKEGEFQPSDEVSEYGYFTLDNLPDIRPRDVVLLNEVYDMMGMHKHELA